PPRRPPPLAGEHGDPPAGKALGKHRVEDGDARRPRLGGGGVTSPPHRRVTVAALQTADHLVERCQGELTRHSSHTHTHSSRWSRPRTTGAKGEGGEAGQQV